MTKYTRKRNKKPGLAPGTPVYVGEARSEPIRMTIFDYDEQGFVEREVSDIGESLNFRDTKTVTWVNVDGIHDVASIEKIGTHFSIHPLTLEDIVNSQQRPKTEDYENYVFVVLKMITFDETESDLKIEQVSFILSRNVVFSFQEGPKGDVFNLVRDRIRSGKGKIRKCGTDYLLYALMDAIVDNYFGVLEKVGGKLERLEEQLVDDPSPKGLALIHKLKGQVYFLRRCIWPLREVISHLQKNDSDLIRETTALYLRDVYDHSMQVLETVEMYRDLLSEMLDVYLSSLSYKMNAVMKVLTIITTIFMPLSFVAGIYGMNFDYMPELHWQYGYPTALGTMGVIVVGMLVFFRVRRWI